MDFKSFIISQEYLFFFSRNTVVQENVLSCVERWRGTYDIHPISFFFSDNPTAVNVMQTLKAMDRLYQDIMRAQLLVQESMMYFKFIRQNLTLFGGLLYEFRKTNFCSSTNTIDLAVELKGKEKIKKMRVLMIGFYDVLIC